MPYSVDACVAAAEALGLKLGYPGVSFDSFDHPTKGCYAYHDGIYDGHVFYGHGQPGPPSVANIGDALTANEKDDKRFRPKGHDCNSKYFLVKYNVDTQ